MLDQLKIPNHIAIIMDGNGRWAKKRVLPLSAGHKKGSQVAKQIVKFAKKLGVKYLTLYAFSSENWLRPKDEVDYLMSLLRQYLKNDVAELTKEGVRIRVIGNRSPLADDIKNLIEKAEKHSKHNEFNLVLALSYGSRDEIRNAAIEMLKDSIASDINPSEITPTTFDKYLYTCGIPDPDLFIRTSGEVRISNFLLWQLAYSELYFTEVLWPDFTENVLIDAIKEFSARERRYGLR